MAAINPHRLTAVENRMDARRAARHGGIDLVPPDNVIHFATDEGFLNRPLYPKQATLLKVMNLATHLLTPHDHLWIKEWTEGFTLDDSDLWQGTSGTPGDLQARISWNIQHGRPWFREVLLLLGAGLPNPLLARHLGIAERTVKAHVARIVETLVAVAQHHGGSIRRGKPDLDARLRRMAAQGIERLLHEGLEVDGRGGRDVLALLDAG